MDIVDVRGKTRTLGEAQGYIPLPIRDEVLPTGERCMVSAWKPTTEELTALMSGACVELSVMGTAHPPVLVRVGRVPE